MNQSRKGLWCVVIGSPSSRWPSLGSRGLCVTSLWASRKRSPRNATRQGIREGTAGLSFRHRGSVISPAQRSDSPGAGGRLLPGRTQPHVGSIAEPSSPLPRPTWPGCVTRARDPGAWPGRVTPGTWPGHVRRLPLFPNLNLERSSLMLEVVRGWFILTEPWRRGPFASAPPGCSLSLSRGCSRSFWLRKLTRMPRRNFVLCSSQPGSVSFVCSELSQLLKFSEY